MRGRGRLWILGLCSVVLLGVVGCGGAPDPAVTTPSPPTPTSGGDEGAVISLVGVPSEAELGEIFEVEVVATGVEDLYGAELHLRYDPLTLEVIDARDEAAEKVRDGSLLTVRFTAQNQVDPTTGRIDYAVAQMPPTQGASGDGSLARIRFRTIGVGSGSVELDEVLLASSRGEAIVWNEGVMVAEVAIR